MVQRLVASLRSLQLVTITLQIRNLHYASLFFAVNPFFCYQKKEYMALSKILKTSNCLKLQYVGFWATQQNSHRKVSYRPVILGESK